jgi:hypothetical protein
LQLLRRRSSQFNKIHPVSCAHTVRCKNLRRALVGDAFQTLLLFHLQQKLLLRHSRDGMTGTILEHFSSRIPKDIGGMNVTVRWIDTGRGRPAVHKEFLRRTTTLTVAFKVITNCQRYRCWLVLVLRWRGLRLPVLVVYRTSSVEETELSLR